MPAIEFKRGKRYLLGRGGKEALGSVVEFVRKQRGSDNKLVFKVLPSGEEITLQAGTFEYHASAVQKKSNKQGSRMLLAHCIFSGYKIRATRYWLMQAVPLCPLCKPESIGKDGLRINATGCNGQPLTMEWED